MNTFIFIKTLVYWFIISNLARVLVSNTQSLTSIELDITKKSSGTGYDYNKDDSSKIITYTVKIGYKISKVKVGNSDVWQSQNDTEYSNKVTRDGTGFFDSLKKVSIYMASGIVKIFEKKNNNWTETSTEQYKDSLTTKNQDRSQLSESLTQNLGSRPSSFTQDSGSKSNKEVREEDSYINSDSKDTSGESQNNKDLKVPNRFRNQPSTQSINNRTTPYTSTIVSRNSTSQNKFEDSKEPKCIENSGSFSKNKTISESGSNLTVYSGSEGSTESQDPNHRVKDDLCSGGDDQLFKESQGKKNRFDSLIQDEEFVKQPQVSRTPSNLTPVTDLNESTSFEDLDSKSKKEVREEDSYINSDSKDTSGESQNNKDLKDNKKQQKESDLNTNPVTQFSTVVQYGGDDNIVNEGPEESVVQLGKNGRLTVPSSPSVDQSGTDEPETPTTLEDKQPVEETKPENKPEPSVPETSTTLEDKPNVVSQPFSHARSDIHVSRNTKSLHGTHTTPETTSVENYHGHSGFDPTVIGDSSQRSTESQDPNHQVKGVLGSESDYQLLKESQNNKDQKDNKKQQKESVWNTNPVTQPSTVEQYEGDDNIVDEGPEESDIPHGEDGGSTPKVPSTPLELTGSNGSQNLTPNPNESQGSKCPDKGLVTSTVNIPDSDTPVPGDGVNQGGGTSVPKISNDTGPKSDGIQKQTTPSNTVNQDSDCQNKSLTVSSWKQGEGFDRKNVGIKCRMGYCLLEHFSDVKKQKF